MIFLVYLITRKEQLISLLKTKIKNVSFQGEKIPSNQSSSSKEEVIINY